MEFRWLGHILAAASLFYLAQGSSIWPWPGLVAGVVMGWAWQGTRIDFKNRKIQEYLGVWGIKIGTWKDLPQVDKITINRSRYRQVLGSRGTSSTFITIVYKAFLRGPDQFTLPFVAHKRSDKVLKNARLVSEKLGLPILDCTVKTPKWIA